MTKGWWGQLTPSFIKSSPQQEEKVMAPHSSILAWEIPWTEETGRLWSSGFQRVGHVKRIHAQILKDVSQTTQRPGGPPWLKALENIGKLQHFKNQTMHF